MYQLIGSHNLILIGSSHPLSSPQPQAPPLSRLSADCLSSTSSYKLPYSGICPIVYCILFVQFLLLFSTFDLRRCAHLCMQPTSWRTLPSTSSRLRLPLSLSWVGIFQIFKSPRDTNQMIRSGHGSTRNLDIQSQIQTAKERWSSFLPLSNTYNPSSLFPSSFLHPYHTHIQEGNSRLRKRLSFTQESSFATESSNSRKFLLSFFWTLQNILPLLILHHELFCHSSCL